MQKARSARLDLADAGHQRRVIGARLLLQHTDVIGIQEKLHGE